MEFRASVDADVDPYAQFAEPSGLTRSEQRPVGADRGLKASGLGCGLKHLVEAAIEQRLAASQEECSDAERLAFADRPQNRLHRELVLPLWGTFHITVQT